MLSRVPLESGLIALTWLFFLFPDRKAKADERKADLRREKRRAELARAQYAPDSAVVYAERIRKIDEEMRLRSKVDRLADFESDDRHSSR
jgi:hypothetical protein